MASSLCSVALLLVGILGQVPQTEALKNFLIFVGCLWSLGNNARKYIAIAFEDLY